MGTLMDTTTATVMTTATVTMTTEAPAASLTLLRLMWLASPALPVGGFSYSEGLEAAIEAQQVHDEASVGAWLVNQLHLAQQRGDLAACAQAAQAWAAGDTAAAQRINDWVRTTRESTELRLQAEQMGRSLAEWLRGQAEGDTRVATLAGFAPAPTWPVAFALAGVRSGASVREVLLAAGLSWAENMVQAAIKAVPLGQSAGQRILGALVQALPAAVEAALATAEGDLQAHSPMLAVLSARHEAQYSRLFRS